ncbi:hypothetical protein R3P38DRAFT_2872384 [Favolaschia claudopus]|uniref:Uncharacterized protein n=1 Tax=Favolaschia claudopus TaxID=2862362 RepID=A0AAW0DCE4_9AGAR
MVNASRHKAKAANDDKENLALRGEAAASSSGSKKKAAYPTVNFIDFQERPALQSVIIKAPPVDSLPYNYCQYFKTAVSAICGAVAIYYRRSLLSRVSASHSFVLVPPQPYLAVGLDPHRRRCVCTSSMRLGLPLRCHVAEALTSQRSTVSCPQPSLRSATRPSFPHFGSILLLFQRSLSHMGSILLVLYFKFIEIKSNRTSLQPPWLSRSLRSMTLLCIRRCSPNAVLHPSNSLTRLPSPTFCLCYCAYLSSFRCRFALLSCFTVPVVVVFVSPSLAGMFQSSDDLTAALCDGSHIRNGFSLLMLVHLPLGRHSRCFDMAPSNLFGQKENAKNR